MSDSDIQVSEVPPGQQGPLVDTSQVSTNAGTVQRQRVAIGDASAGEQVATVTNTGALKTDGSAVTQPVSLAADVNIGNFPATQNVEIPTTATPPHGQAKVATGGTAVELTATPTALAQGIVVQALKQNTDQIYVGASGVTTTHDGTGNGWELQPGQCSPVMTFSDASLVYINSPSNNQGVCWWAA